MKRGHLRVLLAWLALLPWATASSAGTGRNPITSFVIHFEPNHSNFPTAEYRKDLAKLVDLAAEHRDAVIVVLGHADPTQALYALVRVGLSKGLITRFGPPNNSEYLLRGKPLDIAHTHALATLIHGGAFDTGDANELQPRQTVPAALSLSQRRAEGVRREIIAFAKRKRVKLDETQIRARGLGIREPVTALPHRMEDVRRNARVEVRLLAGPAAVTDRDSPSLVPAAVQVAPELAVTAQSAGTAGESALELMRGIDPMVARVMITALTRSGARAISKQGRAGDRRAVTVARGPVGVVRVRPPAAPQRPTPATDAPDSAGLALRVVLLLAGIGVASYLVVRIGRHRSG